MSSLQTFLQTRRRIKQKATLGSALVVLMLFGLFLEAYMHNFNLVYIVLFFVFSLAFIAAIAGIQNLTSLSVRLQRCDRLFAGEISHVYLSLTANKDAQSYALNLKCAGQNHFIPALEGHKALTVPFSLSPEHRGIFTLEGCTIESRFPLSTARLVLPLELKEEKVVYPKPQGISLEAFLSRQRAQYGEENEFEGIIPYAEETALSRIHWPSFAKGEQAVKKYSYDIPLQTLLFDFYTAGSDDEARLSQLTLWILTCEARGLDFQVKLPGGIYDSQRSTVDEILKTLALY